MLLSEFISSEIGDDEEDSLDDIPVKNGAVSAFIHQDVIEAIHKEILLKTQDMDLYSVGRKYILEGIISLDVRESHYRVRTEILGNVGPVYSLEICTITHSLPKVNDNDVKKSSWDFTKLSQPFDKDSIESVNVNNCLRINETINNNDGPLDYTSKMLSSKKEEPSLQQIVKYSDDFTSGSTTNTMLNKIEQVLRGPIGHSSSGTDGFGLGVQRKRGGEVLNLFLCPLCAFCCVKKGELKKHHTTIHLDGKPYGCPFCPYRSTHKSTLRSHVMSRHTGERPFKCTQCDYTASQKGLVDKHIMTKHTGEKPFKCPQCDFSSSHSSTVKTHIMFKHTGEKPFKCPSCHYRAVQRGHILRHMKAVHCKEKPFKCPQCEYRACRNTNIKKHIVAVHNKEKPHQCPHCDFKSSHKGNLNSHMVSKHSGMKPFECDLCEYKSSCRTGLNKHLQKHKGAKKSVLQCHYCPYSSDRKDHLRTHVTYVHFRGNKTLLLQLESSDFESIRIDENLPIKNEEL